MRPQCRTAQVHAIAIAVALTSCLVTGVGGSLAAERRASGDWPDITPQEKKLVSVELDPKADIVILSNTRRGKILHQADDWVNVIEFHWRAKVLNEAGKRFSEIHIPGSKNSRVTGIRARTIKADGTIVNLPEDQIFRKSTVIAVGYRRSEWVFNFPAVEPGAIVEYRYTRYDDFLAYIDPFYFEGPAVTLKAAVSQAIPDEMGYQILCSRCPQAVQPVVKPWVDGPARGKQYSIELSNLQGFGDEVMMPPRRDVSPHLEMVLQAWNGAFIESLGRVDDIFTDWDSVARWAEFTYDKSAKELQPALRVLVNGWVEGIDDPREKLRAILRHIQNDFRYIAWDNVVGGTRAAGDIMKDLSADNEEKAVLTMAAIRMIGMDGHYALVSARNAGAINPSFFSFSQFTHVVVALPDGAGGFEWLDPTVSYAPYGMLPWRDSGAKALLIQKGKGQLVDLPGKVEASRTSYQVSVKPGEAGRGEMAIEAEYVREDAVDMRSELAPQGEKGRQDYLAEWLERRQPGATLTSWTVENLDKLDEPLRITMQATVPGIVTVADDIVLVKGCLLSCLSNNPVPQAARRYPLNLDRGWNVQETVVIQPPAGMKPAGMPPATQMDAGTARISMQCTPTGENAARCLRVFTAPRRQWPPVQMEKVRRLYDEVVKADRTMVAFESAEGG
jgi:hypothetical protein